MRTLIMAQRMVFIGVLAVLVMQYVGLSAGIPAASMSLNQQRTASKAFLTPHHLKPTSGSMLPRTLHPDHAHCELQSEKDACAGVTGCSWCDSKDSSGRLPSGCFLAKFADKMPASTGYTCVAANGDSAPAAFSDDVCLSLKAQDKCDTDATCTWCSAGAIPSECVSKEMAAHLPSGVFQCDSVDAPLEAPKMACLQANDEEACTAGSESDCSWCSILWPEISEKAEAFCVPKVDAVIKYLNTKGKCTA